MKEIGCVIFFFIFFIISSLCAKYETTQEEKCILPFYASVIYGTLFICSLITL